MSISKQIEATDDLSTPAFTRTQASSLKELQRRCRVCAHPYAKEQEQVEEQKKQ